MCTHAHTHKNTYSHVYAHMHICDIWPCIYVIYDHTATLRFRTLAEGLLRYSSGRGVYSLSSIPWRLNWKKKKGKEKEKERKRKEGAERRNGRGETGRVQAGAERCMWDGGALGVAGSRSRRDTNTHGVDKGKITGACGGEKKQKRWTLEFGVSFDGW